jgi:hypothetical protein
MCFFFSVRTFYPHVALTSISSANYPKYCIFQFIFYRPWVGDYDMAADGANSTTNQITDEWEYFALSFAEQGITPPHKMQEAINQIREPMINDEEY